MKTKLGVDIVYQETYNPEVLDFIPRQKKNTTISFYGHDIWHAYEFSWLDNDGNPENAILKIIIPADSDSLVESKSLKLYLGSFSFEKVASIQTVVETIQKDLSKGIKKTVEVQALPPDALTLMPQIVKGYCMDLHSIRNPKFEVSPDLLKIGSSEREEILYTHNFRSLCPVTSQPDWASIYVMYKGKEIYPEELRHYLLSYRKHNGFHESCCEQIFIDIMQRCQPEELGVMCCFTRRGGIDITPIRSNSLTNRMQFARTVRQ